MVFVVLVDHKVMFGWGYSYSDRMGSDDRDWSEEELVMTEEGPGSSRQEKVAKGSSTPSSPSAIEAYSEGPSSSGGVSSTLCPVNSKSKYDVSVSFSTCGLKGGVICKTQKTRK